MKFTLAWLKDHLDTQASLEDISKTLTMIGLEVEQIIDRAAALKPFTVAKILHAEQHPQADKLRVCRVESDSGELQIVCGAPNARAGIYVALAKEGTVIPANGMVIKKTKIRGVESNGMLCSADELALPGDSRGIIELPGSPRIGQSIVEVLGLSDPVIDIAVTPNRADALSVRGIARDLAAAGLGKLKENPIYAPENDCESFWKSSYFAVFDSPIRVSIKTPVCEEFEGYYIRGVANHPSPDWMKKRLEAVGQKSISALVDITNYLMLDLGRPMHIYDADKLNGKITVRTAMIGETFKALNGKEYTLDETMTVIADDSGTIGLAGIIGGETTGCSDTTTNAFLELAYFDPIHISRTGRALDILSDARFRFERKVDPVTNIKINHPNTPDNEGSIAALTTYLVHKFCGGVASHWIHEGLKSGWVRKIKFNPKSISTLGGVDIHAKECEIILESLGFSVENLIEINKEDRHFPQLPQRIQVIERDGRFYVDNSLSAELMSLGVDYKALKYWEVTPPSWRGDVEGEADLVEEVLRINGYDHIPATPLPKLAAISKPALNTAQKRVHLAKRMLASRGMLEACTWSFLPEAQAKLFGGGNPKLKLLNPISADLDTMRPSLLPNLLEAAKKNAFRGFKDISLFEVGLQFHDVTPDGQRMVAAGLRCNKIMETSYSQANFQQLPRPVDVFDAKADAISVLETLGIVKYDITNNTPSWYHPSQSGALTLGGKIILGYFGVLHPGLLLNKYDFEKTIIAGFEIFLDAIPTPRAKGKAKPPLKLSEFQAVERDFAFTVDEKITAAEITKAIAQADKLLVTDVAIFDVYAGKGIEPGKKSVAVKVTLQSFERTLSEQDIAAVSQAIIAAAAKGFGGQLRQMTPDYWDEAKQALKKRDKTLGKIIDGYHGETMALRGDAFYTLARSITGQQISVKAADSVWRKLTESIERITPEIIANSDGTILRSCGLSTSKVLYLHALANHFLENKRLIKQWPTLADSEIIEELTSIKGIGRWTAEMFLMFGLGRPDVFPIADLGLLKGVYRHYNKGEKMPMAEVMAVGERWRPWRTVGTWYMWRALDPLPVAY